MRYWAIVIILLLTATGSRAQPYKYLALKGGGIRGIAYAGALKVLEERNITAGIEKVAGTSVGSITGALFCLGYSAGQIEEIMYTQDIAAFNDGEGYFIGGQQRMRRRYGWYKGKRMELWIGNLVRAKTGDENTTLLQLHQLALKDTRYKDLYVTVTNLSMQRLEVFSWETHPDLPIKIAVRASAAIPMYFAAVFIDSSGHVADKPRKGVHYNVYVDGGLVANYPISVFKDENSRSEYAISRYTLGLKLERPEQIAYARNNSGIAPYEINSFPAYVGALYNLIIEQLNKGVAREEEKNNTIYISTSNLNPRVRFISHAQKQQLFENGEKAARAFFDSRK